MYPKQEIHFVNKKARYFNGLKYIGGEGEIRTHGGIAPSTVFKTAALNRSATHPGICRRCRVLVEILAHQSCQCKIFLLHKCGLEQKM